MNMNILQVFWCFFFNGQSTSYHGGSILKRSDFARFGGASILGNLQLGTLAVVTQLALTSEVEPLDVWPGT